LADEDDFGVRQGGPNQACGFETVSVRHGDIHQNDIGAQFVGLVDALDAIGGLAADLEIGTAGEKGTDATAYKLVVIDD
jgi:hypothetical protein